MRKVIVASVVLAGLSAGVVAAADGTVVILPPGQPAVVGMKDIVRVAPTGQPVLNVQHRLTGPAKLVTFTVRDLTAPAAVATPARVEYEIVPTGKGKVTLELISVAPGSKHPLVTGRYEFEVK